jgi:hypothetical protein
MHKRVLRMLRAQWGLKVRNCSKATFHNDIAARIAERGTKAAEYREAA